VCAIRLRRRTQRETSWAQIGQISRILSARDFPMSDPMRSGGVPIGGSEGSGGRTFALLSATKSARIHFPSGRVCFDAYRAQQGD
jgi:hypothetical protein